MTPTPLLVNLEVSALVVMITTVWALDELKVGIPPSHDFTLHTDKLKHKNMEVLGRVVTTLTAVAVAVTTALATLVLVVVIPQWASFNKRLDKCSAALQWSRKAPRRDRMLATTTKCQSHHMQCIGNKAILLEVLADLTTKSTLNDTDSVSMISTTSMR